MSSSTDTWEAKTRTVVIGAGIGGLTAAALLAARGADVTVVEKEPRPGGKIRRIAVGESAIDGGPTVFTMRDVFDAIFDACGASLESEVTLRPAHILARHAWDSGPRLDLFADPQASADAIGVFAGTDAARGFRSFSAEAKRMHDILETPFLRNTKVWPPGLMWRIGLWRLAKLRAIRPYESLWEVLGEHFRDPRLQQLFGRYSTYCGSSPFETPATLMLIAHVEASGVWLIDGGLSAIAEALERLARRAGVQFRYGEAVQSILIERGRAAGVVTASGERIDAGAVIANADPAAVAAGRFGPAVRRAVSKVPPRRRSLSAFTWAMEAEVEGPPMVRHNVFFSPDYPAEFDDLRSWRPPRAPSVYVCALDRDAGDAPQVPDKQRLQVIVNAPPNGDHHVYTPEEIETCTRAMLARLTSCGLEISPTSLPHIATPNSFERLCPSTGGALYGRASHGWAASFLRQSSRTRIPGLYCAGGSTHPGAGVPMAALSGQLAADALMKDLASTVRWRQAAMPGGISTRSATTEASASPSSASSAASSALIT
jgi:1-hydroxycarotenoid 3,4-desaturase